MSQITAVIADTSSIGYVGMQSARGVNTAFSSYKTRRNPQNAVARIRTIMNPHIVQEVPGGMISADFVVPAEEAQRWRPMLRYGAYCWLFDGQTPVFFGFLEQPTWSDGGDAQITVSGPWVWLGKSRTREVWELRDMNLLYRGASTNEKRNASTQVRNDGSLLLSFSDGQAVASGTYVSVEYYLFGEDGPSGFDDKFITGFEVHLSDATFNGNANLVFRVQSISGNTGIAGTTLWSTTATGSSNRQTASDVFSENSPAGAWSGGTRGLRFGIFATANITAGGGAFAVVDRIRITTRESLFPTSASTHDTAQIARDLLAPRSVTAAIASGGGAQYDLVEPFWPSDVTNTNTDAAVKYGRDAVTGTGSAPDSGVGITGFNILDWTSPAEILLQLAGIDGSHVGFYLPYNQRGGYDAGNVNDTGTSLWVSARPQLFYQAWPDPASAPDYTIHVREGAQVEPDPAGSQQLLNLAYTGYQTNRGRQLSSIAKDGDPVVSATGTDNAANYLSNQGFTVAENWQVDSSVNTNLASSLSTNMLEVRRQPFAASKVTLTNDGVARWPILKAGAQIPHLSQVRPGSVRLVDLPSASGLRAGYATRVEWWGQTLDAPERVEMTLGDPGQMLLERRLAWTAMRANRQLVSG